MDRGNFIIDSMTEFKKKISLRWSDLDPNFHVRHSVYYDFAAQQRIEILEELGLTLKVMKEQHFGPVLFREECIFRREIRLADTITITASMSKCKPDASRWSIRHEFLNAENKTLATINVDGAWMDTELRKMASPTPKIVSEILHSFPKTDDFTES